jgi:hypothetical protein
MAGDVVTIVFGHRWLAQRYELGPPRRLPATSPPQSAGSALPPAVSVAPQAPLPRALPAITPPREHPPVQPRLPVGRLAGRPPRLRIATPVFLGTAGSSAAGLNGRAGIDPGAGRSAERRKHLVERGRLKVAVFRPPITPALAWQAPDARSGHGQHDARLRVSAARRAPSRSLFFCS